MTKEQALEEFFSGLKIAFNISSLYKKEHPSFIKSVIEFKNKVDTALTFFNPLRIGITPNSLVVENNTFSGCALYEDLARIFHQRRIKSIEIKKEINLEEIIAFLSKSSAPQREIFKEGGLINMLSRENVKNISTSELDYYQLLKSESRDYDDIWAYLLKDAVALDDVRKINELADNFDKLAKKLKLKELLENEEEKRHLQKFLDYLKKVEKDKFRKCLRDLAESIIEDKSNSGRVDFDKLKAFFEQLKESDYSSILSGEILYNDNFDSLSFNLFCKLVETKDHEKIAFLTENTLRKKYLKDGETIKKKIESIFSLPDNPTISEVYRGTLASFLKELTFDKSLTLDRDALKADYRLILLNLLSFEEDKEKLSLILDKISQIWEEMIRGNDLKYLKILAQILIKKKKKDGSFDAVFAGIEKLISGFVENLIWNENIPLEIENFIDTLRTSSQNSNYYIVKIFEENKLNRNILKLFLRFFPDEVNVFCKNIEKKRSDLDFIEKIIETLKTIDSNLSVEILKCIYNVSNNLIKAEVLNAMQCLSSQDNYFLLPILKNEDIDISLKKAAFKVLIRDETAKQQALKRFFSMPSPWGAKNKILLENMGIVQELGLFEAKNYLTALSKKPFFWNRNIRQKAGEILRELNDKKD